MLRASLLCCTLLLAPLARAQGDAGPAPDEVRQLMREGLERALPAPSPHARPEWPRAEAPAPRAPPPGAELGARRLQAMAERVRQDASARARAVAEERRTTPDNQPGASQSRTRAAKAANPAPPRPTPPKP